MKTQDAMSPGEAPPFQVNVMEGHIADVSTMVADGEREALIRQLRDVLGKSVHVDIANEAADMLAADAQEIYDLKSSKEFYQRRVELLQKWQSKMRDPERTIACDIIANGQTLPPENAGDRYKITPGAQQVAVPPGWQMIPLSLTPAMRIVLLNAAGLASSELYTMLLAAAPQPPLADRVLPCAHEKVRVDYDYVQCESCGAVKHDAAGDGWHPSLNHAKRYARGES